MIEPTKLSGTDRDTLLRFQRAKVRLDSAKLYEIADQQMFNDYFEAIEDLGMLEDAELRKLGEQAAMPLDLRVPIWKLERRRHAAEKKLLEISLGLENLFPLATHTVQ